MQETPLIPGARFVDPAVLARVGNLDLVARSVVDGVINGLHRTPYFGASVDFAEHRGYVPGDDIRRVDWRLYARTDRYYIKEYEADSNSNFSVLLDVSKSMGFGTRGMTKLEYGKLLAGCITYLVHRQRDRVGLVVFDNDIVELVPPSAKHMDVSLHVLDRVQPSNPGQLRVPLHKVAEHFGRRGLLGPVLDALGWPVAFSTTAVVIAQTFVALPFLVVSLEGTLRSVGQRYEVVAATLGARPTVVLGRVTLPLVAPGLASATILSASPSPYISAVSISVMPRSSPSLSASTS